MSNKIRQHKARAIIQDENLQELNRIIDFFDAFIERMFPQENLELFDIKQVQLSNALIAFTDMHFFQKELDQCKDEIDHYINNNGDNDPMYRPLNLFKEKSYLQRMIDIK